MKEVNIMKKEMNILIENMKKHRLLSILSLAPMLVWLVLVVATNAMFIGSFGTQDIGQNLPKALLIILAFILVSIFSMSPTKLGKIIMVISMTALIYFLVLAAISEPKFNQLYPQLTALLVGYYGIINVFSLRYQY